ncbi:MAG: DUF4252 domain-containing protein [Bacteroidetes bacterium]|nr:DUF4252 domain-containing protein [Bacteroidota bacterium]
MKRTHMNAILIALFLVPVWSMAQNSTADKIFDEYSGKDGYTSIDISKGLFELFSEIEADDPEFDEFQKAINGLESMRLLAYSVEKEKGTLAEKNNFMKAVKNGVSLKDFKELMVVRDKDAKIDFYAKSEGQIITEMIMIVDGKDDAVLLSLYGDIDLNHIAKLGAAMNMGGMDYLGKMQSE